MRWSLNFMVPKCVTVRAPEKTIGIYKIFILLASWYCVLILICLSLNYFIHECEEIKGNSYKCISPFTLSDLVCDLQLFLHTQRSWFVLETNLSNWKLASSVICHSLLLTLICQVVVIYADIPNELRKFYSSHTSEVMTFSTWLMWMFYPQYIYSDHLT